MILMPFLLAAVTLNPFVAQRASLGPIEGTVRGTAVEPDHSCKAGAICASGTLPNRNGCYANNFWNNNVGGTPLTIDITQTGSNGSKVYIYWVNATNQTISIKSNAQAKYYCP